MSVFGHYSTYYNLLYKDKDYSGEADYTHRLIQKYRPDAKTILDLGCGTGRHDIILSQKGYAVTGVDLSEEMLAVAHASVDSPSPAPQPSFQQGDIRTVRLGKTFDVVVSLFHVMSYQIDNKDLEAAFFTAREHLNPGGVFLFDCWYGPAVLTDKPAVRVKKFEDASVEIVRIARPDMHVNLNRVDVNYEVLVIDKATKKTNTFFETHKMRYLFQPEIIRLFEINRIAPRFSGEWLTGRELSTDTWSACFRGGI